MKKIEWYGKTKDDKFNRVVERLFGADFKEKKHEYELSKLKLNTPEEI